MAQPAPNSIDWGEQFDRYYPMVYRYFRYRGADSDTANDLASAVFERALTKLDSYNPRKAAFGTWLYAIAHNLSINHWKAQTRSRVVPLEMAASRPGSAPPPEDTLVTDEDNACLLAALQTLEDREREILALKFAGELNNRQIASLMRLSPGNVGVILYRTLHRLQDLLAETEGKVQDE